MARILTEVEREHNDIIKAAINALNANSDDLEKQIAREEANYDAHKDDPEWIAVYGETSKRTCETLRKEVIWNFFQARNLKKELI